MKSTDSDDRTVAGTLPGSISFENETAPTVSRESQGVIRANTRILVVDDEPATRQVMVEILRCVGYQVEASENGLVGWDALRAGRHQLLITDHCMPQLTGVELIQRLRAAGSELPCLLVSGALPYDRPDLPGELQPGATLAKPFRPRELLARVDALLRAHLVSGVMRRHLVPA